MNKTVNAFPVSEHELQVSLCDYLGIMGHPDVFWSAIPNGGFRSIGVAMKLKREGVKRGPSDLFFILPDGRTAWLELKVKGGALSTEQKLFRDCCKANGHAWAVAKSLDEAKDFLRSVGALKLPKHEEANSIKGENK
jgi:hypothetical protein